MSDCRIFHEANTRIERSLQDQAYLGKSELEYMDSNSKKLVIVRYHKIQLIIQ